MTNNFLRTNAGNWVYNIADALKGDVENLAETICPGVIETKRGGHDESCFRAWGMRQGRILVVAPNR